MTKNGPNHSPPFGQTAILAEVVVVMRSAHGLDVSGYEETFLAKSVEKRLQATAGETPAAYLDRLAEDGAEAEAFFRSLRVTYSEFFRNPIAFALLEQSILPGLPIEHEKSGRGEIRVWSAGCAAGQEAWSVAILLDELTGAKDTSSSHRIFATDLFEADLAVARTGVYGVEAVGNVRSRHLRECFSRQGESFSIAPRIREHVDFSAYDLLDERTICPPTSIYGDFDLVLCSNVLLYYRPEARRFILDKVRRCLAPGGYLITGETERQLVVSAGGFSAVAPPATVFQSVSETKGR